MTLSIIGAGFGRTGTLSLKQALERLTGGRCYHMTEVPRNPGHAAQWDRAADRYASWDATSGAAPSADWDALFAGYDAVVDWPACHFWRELADHYPMAKFVLSVRDPQRWYESVNNTIYQALTGAEEATLPAMQAQLQMARKIVLREAFGGRFEDRAHAIEVFERHAREVQEALPAERLLVFEASQGWEPLCRFLSLPVPDEVFPHVNSTEEFRLLLDAMAQARQSGPE